MRLKFLEKRVEPPYHVMSEKSPLELHILFFNRGTVVVDGVRYSLHKMLGNWQGLRLAWVERHAEKPFVSIMTTNLKGDHLSVVLAVEGTYYANSFFVINEPELI